MYLLDDDNKLVDSEFSLDIFEGSPCVTVESSGGSSPSRGVKRRNPDYNKLLNFLFRRFALAEVQITKVVLDSKKVADIPVAERTAKLDQPYPINLSSVDVEEFRKMVGRAISGMHRAPNAKSSGNAQKRIQICLDESILPDQLLTLPGAGVLSEDIPDHLPGLAETEREYLSTARRGQGQFRKNLIQAYDSTCPLTGIANPELLIASHIKPWKACTNQERLDPNNGILLSALFDRLFDRGLISFDDEGNILPSPLLSLADRERCKLDSAKTLELSSESCRFMVYHREYQYQNQPNKSLNPTPEGAG